MAKTSSTILRIETKGLARAQSKSKPDLLGNQSVSMSEFAGADANQRTIEP